jgi:hypothetical protein
MYITLYNSHYQRAPHLWSKSDTDFYQQIVTNEELGNPKTNLHISKEKTIKEKKR